MCDIFIITFWLNSLISECTEVLNYGKLGVCKSRYTFEFLCLTDNPSSFSARGRAFLTHCTLVSLLPRVCSRSLVVQTGLLMGTLDPAFVLAPELLITAKPLITDLTLIDYSECSAHSTVSRDLTLKKWNTVDKTEFFLHWLSSSMNLKIRGRFYICTQACRSECSILQVKIT